MGTCDSKECDQSETGAGAGHVVPQHSSNFSFERCLAAKDSGRGIDSIIWSLEETIPR